MKITPAPTWSVEDSKEIYNVDHWGDGFFDFNEKGHVVVYPLRKKNCAPIDLQLLTQELITKQLTLPILIRFPDILKQRVNSLYDAFLSAIQNANYTGEYHAVYPIKANQQRYVVSEIINNGLHTVGMEAGSKPELLAVLALAEKPGSLIICNGYKDREYIRLALIGQLLGHRVFIILEKFSEIDIVMSEARKMGVSPNLGVRIRSAASLTGKWQKSGGEKSKFGLTASQVLSLIERLEQENWLDKLQLLHFHFGSQLANIIDIQKGVRECARYYSELRKLGAPIQIVDVGGGLGVDYDGTHSRRVSSINYSMQEYANNIVFTLLECCDANGLPHPSIVTESGRAMTAHHAVLVTNVVECETIQFPKLFCLDDYEDDVLIRNLYDGLQSLTARTAIEAYHDACYWMQEAQSKYLHGIMDLKKRAHVEQLYLATCWHVRELLKYEVKAHREVFEELNEKLADKFFVNFSLFQSLPDAWAIDQVFPIVPVAGLEQKPDRRAILQDLTCDSDGCIEIYIDGQGLEKTLPLPAFRANQPNWMGIFLVGAYQEILGDMHNLFGDTDSVNVVSQEGGYRLEQAISGDLVKDVLRYVHFDADKLIQSYHEQFDRSSLSEPEKVGYLQELIAGMHGYTYLED